MWCYQDLVLVQLATTALVLHPTFFLFFPIFTLPVFIVLSIVPTLEAALPIKKNIKIDMAVWTHTESWALIPWVVQLA